MLSFITIHRHFAVAWATTRLPTAIPALQINNTSLLSTYEQFYIKSHCYRKVLIPEQNAGENKILSSTPTLRHHVQYTPLNYTETPNFLQLSIEHTFLPTRLPMLTVSEIF
jgi:hypothetical protein